MRAYQHSYRNLLSVYSSKRIVLSLGHFKRKAIDLSSQVDLTQSDKIQYASLYYTIIAYLLERRWFLLGKISINLNSLTVK